MKTAVLVLALLLMACGVAASVFPVVPGAFLVFGGMLIYAIYEHFETLTPAFLAGMFLLALLSLFVDNIASVVGARRYGGSKAGLWGALIGGLIGVAINPLVGVVLGPFLGALGAELAVGRKPLRGALRVALGTLFGFLGGVVARLLIGTLMVVAFLGRIF